LSIWDDDRASAAHCELNPKVAVFFVLSILDTSIIDFRFLFRISLDELGWHDSDQNFTFTKTTNEFGVYSESIPSSHIRPNGH
jgi:hypothetical protein